MPGAGWRGRRPGVREPAGADLLMALRPAPERLLTLALRRIARRRPDVFERLGKAREAAFVIAPTDFPVAFRLRPAGLTGEVRVVRHGDGEPCAARVTGPLALLLSLLDGSADADATFFSRRVRVEGDTEAVVALHNTLEAADLALPDLFGLKPPLRAPVGAALSLGLTRLRAMSGETRTR